jgi:hypothetical protein
MDLNSKLDDFKVQLLNSAGTTSTCTVLGNKKRPLKDISSGLDFSKKNEETPKE